MKEIPLNENVIWEISQASRYLDVLKTIILKNVLCLDDKEVCSSPDKKWKINK